MSRNPIRLMQMLRHHHIHHPKRQSSICTREWLNMLIRRTCSQRPNRINNNNARPIALSFTQERHHMRGSTSRIATPDQHQFTVYEYLWCRCQPTTNSQYHRLFSSMTTDSTLQSASAQPIPETTISNSAIDQPQRPRIAIGQN